MNNFKTLGDRGHGPWSLSYLHVCSDISRNDTVYLDVVLAPFVAERLGELTQSTLRGSVSRDGEPALV